MLEKLPRYQVQEETRPGIWRTVDNLDCEQEATALERALVSFERGRGACARRVRVRDTHEHRTGNLGASGPISMENADEQGQA